MLALACVLVRFAARARLRPLVHAVALVVCALLALASAVLLMRAISLPQALLVAHHFLYRWTSELFDTEPFLPEHLDGHFSVFRHTHMEP